VTLPRDSTVSVAVCFDTDIIPGVHATLRSARAHLPKDIHLEVFAITDRVPPQALDQLKQSIDSAGGSSEIQLIPFSPACFSRYKWLGGYMTYARLMLGELVDRSRLIYLDSDLVVTTDLTEIFHWDLAGNLLGAVCDTVAGQSNDAALYREFGHDPAGPNFNAGVMVIDLTQWRESECTEAAMRFAEKFADRLRTADQTVINFAFYGRICRLPWRLNVLLQPDQAAPHDTGQPGIYHFIGRPKPWDLFGKTLNQHHSLFARHFAGCSINSSARKSLGNLVRTLRISRSYGKSIRAKFRAWKSQKKN
jgi:lipopolysaccharide biosynthesis glycosyltransferase